ncbi:MAG: hypothetical protein K2I68_02345, partial [Bacteroidales bacterium]|nr:hypothetical protein [Bacteroidales bacterium]
MKQRIVRFGLAALLLAALNGAAPAQDAIENNPTEAASEATPAISKFATVENPFDLSWADQPFNAPPFDYIKLEHYLPALEKAIAAHEAEIEAIVNNREEPTFENTLLAFDR